MTTADRIAALEAELAEAHKRIVDMEAHDARWMSRHDDAQSALAFEKSAHDRTQAEAAAMRLVLQRVGDWCEADHVCEVIDYSIDGDAGRDLAERVLLLEAVAKAARKVGEAFSPSTSIVAGDELRDALAALDKDT